MIENEVKYSSVAVVICYASKICFFIGLINLWCYLLIQRNSKGMWIFMAYSMLPKDCMEHIKIKLSIFNDNDSRRYSFECKTVSFETSREEAIELGHYFCLHDSQVKPFKSSNNLFEYSVEIQANHEFLAIMNKSASSKETNDKGTITKESNLINDEINRTTGS